jgi:sulfide:quinone oxidoreductase
MANIIVMGAGIGSMPAAYELRALLPKEHKVTVVNATDYFQFVPSNPWVAVGWRERDAVTLPIAPYLERKGIAFIPKAVTAIDAAGNRLTLDGGQALAYDYLIITTGPKLNLGGSASHSRRSRRRASRTRPSAPACRDRRARCAVVQSEPA